MYYIAAVMYSFTISNLFVYFSFGIIIVLILLIYLHPLIAVYFI